MRAWCMVLVLVGCRQPNPDWMGPASIGDDAGDGFTDSNATMAGDDANTGGATSGADTNDPMPVCDDPDHEKFCGNRCVNIWDDRKNCGDCDLTCPPSEQCDQAQCG